VNTAGTERAESEMGLKVQGGFIWMDIIAGTMPSKSV